MNYSNSSKLNNKKIDKKYENQMHSIINEYQYQQYQYQYSRPSSNSSLMLTIRKQNQNLKTKMQQLLMKNTLTAQRLDKNQFQNYKLLNQNNSLTTKIKNNEQKQKLEQQKNYLSNPSIYPQSLNNIIVQKSSQKDFVLFTMQRQRQKKQLKNELEFYKNQNAKFKNSIQQLNHNNQQQKTKLVHLQNVREHYQMIYRQNDQLKGQIQRLNLERLIQKQNYQKLLEWKNQLVLQNQQLNYQLINIQQHMNQQQITHQRQTNRQKSLLDSSKYKNNQHFTQLLSQQLIQQKKQAHPNLQQTLAHSQSKKLPNQQLANQLNSQQSFNFNYLSNFSQKDVLINKQININPKNNAFMISSLEKIDQDNQKESNIKQTNNNIQTKHYQSNQIYQQNHIFLTDKLHNQGNQSDNMNTYKFNINTQQKLNINGQKYNRVNQSIFLIKQQNHQLHQQQSGINNFFSSILNRFVRN